MVTCCGTWMAQKQRYLALCVTMVFAGSQVDGKVAENGENDLNAIYLLISSRDCN